MSSSECLGEYLAIELPARSAKPRTAGLTMVMDTGWPVTFVESQLDLLGAYLDVVKLWDCHLRAPQKEIRRKIAAYRAHDVRVQAGGIFIEIAEAQGRTDEMLERLAELGFNQIEVSSTASTRRAEDLARSVELIEPARRFGFHVYGEVGKKFFVGDETRVAEDEINEEVTISEFRTLLEAGAEKVYWEGHLLRRVMGESPAELLEKEPRGTAQVRRVVEAVGRDAIVFEVSPLVPLVSRRSLQFWLIRQFGPDVNFGNARLEELGHLEALRQGSHPVFGFGEAGNYPWLRSVLRHQGQASQAWWTEDPVRVGDGDPAARLAGGR
ncbi:MAG: phosphosulfolactate synthase [Chloroflexi bacterium]|nr:phosphosulfolactate synthase [Chloroflexota bacterium]